jgi:hypothetical protein
MLVNIPHMEHMIGYCEISDIFYRRVYGRSFGILGGISDGIICHVDMLLWDVADTGMSFASMNLCKDQRIVAAIIEGQQWETSGWIPARNHQK